MPKNVDSAVVAPMNSQLLQWHAGAASIDMESFRLWALAGLSECMRFDGAIWGVAGSASEAHFHRTSGDALQGSAGASMLRRIAAAPSGSAWVFDPSHPGDGDDVHGDSASADDTPRDEAQRDDAAAAEHALRYGLRLAVAVRYADPGGVGSDQFLLLRRDGPGDPFDAEERAALELLAPHMMLSFSICRRLQLAGAVERGGQGAVRASALVDRTGRLHESDSRFLRTLRREWPDWAGARLPDALLNHRARKLASRWQFLGKEITADFVPVNSLFLVTARFRLPADSLTTREWDIARRYASGSDFREVAEALQVAPATVRSHLRRVFSKLGVRNKSQLSTCLE